MLLDGREGIELLHLLDIGRHGEGGDFPQGQVAVLTPGEEAAGCGGVGGAGIGVSDLSGEELKEAPLSRGAGLPDGGGQALDPPAAGNQERGRGPGHRQRGRR